MLATISPQEAASRVVIHAGTDSGTGGLSDVIVVMRILSIRE
jgi:hypothetical protein